LDFFGSVYRVYNCELHHSTAAKDMPTARIAANAMTTIKPVDIVDDDAGEGAALGLWDGELIGVALHRFHRARE
jgi:hypothetical protein